MNDKIKEEGDVSLANKKLWESKGKFPELEICTKKGVSGLYTMTKCTFNTKFKINKLIKCIYAPAHRKSWDSNLVRMEVIDQGKSPVYFHQYTQHKKVLTYAPREFYEKIFQFAHEEVYYRLSSSVYTPEGTQNEEVFDDTLKEKVRADVLFNLTKIYRNAQGKIEIVIISNIDPKGKLPKIVVGALLAKSTKAWYDNVVKYYTKNHKDV